MWGNAWWFQAELYLFVYTSLTFRLVALWLDGPFFLDFALECAHVFLGKSWFVHTR